MYAMHPLMTKPDKCKGDIQFPCLPVIQLNLFFYSACSYGPGQDCGTSALRHTEYDIVKFTPDNKQFDCFTVNISPPVSELNQSISSKAGLFIDMQ